MDHFFAGITNDFTCCSATGYVPQQWGYRFDAIRCRKICNPGHLTHWKEANWRLRSSHNSLPFSYASHTYSLQLPRWKLMDEGSDKWGPLRSLLCCPPPAAPLCPFPCLPLCHLYWPSCVCGGRVDGPWVLSGDGRAVSLTPPLCFWQQWLWPISGDTPPAVMDGSYCWH